MQLLGLYLAGRRRFDTIGRFRLWVLLRPLQNRNVRMAQTAFS